MQAQETHSFDADPPSLILEKKIKIIAAHRREVHKLTNLAT
jgi:hypothetical protein